jgi:hypothetical protein
MVSIFFLNFYLLKHLKKCICIGKYAKAFTDMTIRIGLFIFIKLKVFLKLFEG